MMSRCPFFFFRVFHKKLSMFAIVEQDVLLSQNLDSLRLKTEFLKELADQTQEEARLTLQIADEAKNIYQNSRKELVRAEREKTNSLLRQAKNGRDFQDDLVKQYENLKISREEDGEEASDFVVNDVVERKFPYNTQIVGKTPQQIKGRNCFGFDELESSTYRSMTDCVSQCYRKHNNKCSHATYNEDTKSCVLYAKEGNGRDVVTEDTCVVDPKVRTVVFPGVACQGCSE